MTESSYPWGKWSNGEMWSVKHGRDFLVEPEVFVKVVRAQARAQGVKASAVHAEGAACFQFHRGDGHNGQRLEALRQLLGRTR
ncbi:hypothetical protein ABZ667_16080 [Streptomyces lavendulae]|uniref:hypothetical protein n=1 Tax=Streptomyces lavendulae TaxID=1914 RepID=UPI00340AC056